MNFIRGESTDTQEKGERYAWAHAPRHQQHGGGHHMHNVTRKRQRPQHDNDDDDDAYFEDSDEGGDGAAAPAVTLEDDPLEAYLAGLQQQQQQQSTASSTSKAPAPAPAEDEEEDPLDAFMRKQAQTEAAAPAPASVRHPAVAQCDEADDHVASFLESSAAAAGRRGSSVDGDADADETNGSGGVGVGGPRRKLGKQQQMELTEAIDHGAIEYPPFDKELYRPHPTIRMMSEAEIAAYRSELDLTCTGFDVPAPIKLFEHAGLPRELLHCVKRRGFDAPTPIQCQSLPVALSGRDAIGVAATGSGKTAAYLLPAITHCLAQPALQRGDGPIALVLCPTHELCEQIVQEARKLIKPLGLRACGLFGGVGKFEQYKELKQGCEIVIGTPGRTLELAKDHKNGLSLRRVTFVVLDEADRMFSLGFEPQVRSVVNQVRPDRQTLLFSATFKPALERLARDTLSEPVRLTVGMVGDANEDVTQVI